MVRTAARRLRRFGTRAGAAERTLRFWTDGIVGSGETEGPSMSHGFERERCRDARTTDPPRQRQVQHQGTLRLTTQADHGRASGESVSEWPQKTQKHKKGNREATGNSRSRAMSHGGTSRVEEQDGKRGAERRRVARARLSTLTAACQIPITRKEMSKM